MKLRTLLVLGTVLLAVPVFAEEPTVLKTEKERVNYAIGVNMINNIVQQGVDIDLEMVIKGMRDAYSDRELLLSEDELRKSMSKYMTDARQKQAQVLKTTAERNIKASEVFLAENAKKAGIVTLPSGLQYQILKAGSGKKPAKTDSVECNYRGTLINGKEFDSSFRTGKPVTFKVAGLIPGFTEALQLMPVGSKWQLFIPPKLAYGERGARPDIEPNATLIFEVELLGIK